MPTEPAAAEDRADPFTMTLFHSALRRDVTRVRLLLGDPGLSVRRRRRLGRHLQWVMAQLRWHHEGEDHSLWPVLLDRDPASRVVLDAMEAEHESLDGPLLALEAAARGLVADRATAADALAALDELEGPLLAHLTHEEQEGLEIVRRALSHREWQAFEKRAWIDGYTAADTLRFLRWIADGVRWRPDLVRRFGVPAALHWPVLKPLSRSARWPALTVWSGTPAARVPSAAGSTSSR
ncbi:hemerythrin domain-containing protein [Occultella aeris]|nr:hemerythrin domain-containing protein [Occultella aeris]